MIIKINQKEKLSKIFSETEIKEIELAVENWSSTDNIEMKIQSTVISGVFRSVSIQVNQHYLESGIYLTREELISKAEDIFRPYILGRILYVDAFPYKPVIVDIVNKEWLEKRMVLKGVRIKDIATDTGIDKTNLSGWISGLKPMSQSVKAMFYFYLTRPADKHHLISTFFDDLSSAIVGTTIKIVTEFLSEVDVRPWVIKKALELNCIAVIGDFSTEITDVTFKEKRFFTA